MSDSLAPRRAVRGKVTSFDEAAGLGEVSVEDGRLLGFHCTQIADGTRTIDPCADVLFDIAPTHLGRWEARALQRLP